MYVVLLAEDVLRKERPLRVNPDRDPACPCVYVGMSSRSAAVRFYNHKRGHKASRWVRRYGIRLLPDFHEMLDRLSYEEAEEEEGKLAAYLREGGWTVLAGHHDHVEQH